MNIKLIDLTDYTLKWWEGIQFFNYMDAIRFFNENKKINKQMDIQKDIKPNFFNKNEWKQTYTIIKKLKGGLKDE